MMLDSLRAHLDDAGIRLAVDGFQLKIIAPPGALTLDSKAAIKAHKTSLLIELTGFAPLDEGIIESFAHRNSREMIEACVARLTAHAADPAATALDHQVLRDWLAIRDANVDVRATVA
ncbi:MAG: hypothetical protein M3464_00375 [Chloroflexota bacterium]|nr:hypothetical protein [Chloroflexota bacterium]